MNLEKIKQSAIDEVEAASNIEVLEKIRIKYLARRGLLTQILRSLKDLPLDQRQKIGPVANFFKKELIKLIEDKKEQLKEEVLEKIDLTRPAAKIHRGHFHPLTIVEEKICRIFSAMNFSIVEGPEIETEYFNFDALNIPPFHPARDLWNTLWLKTPKTPKTQIDADKTPKTQINADKTPKTQINADRTQINADTSRRSAPTQINADRTQINADNINVAQRRRQRQSALLLRTHTSPVQIRYMQTHQPPFQIIAPGRVFRYEATDASHEINFHQVEGLMVGENVSLANFKFIVEEFFKKFFGQNIELRYRPSYFPFVEPGLEVEIKLKNSWLEVMGAGMVHQKVFEAVRYNPYEIKGFAFGLGLERLAMIKYKISDIRLFYSGDLRFIKQF